MKRIFLYYSLTGNGDVVADYLRKKKCDIEKVVSMEKLPKNKFFQIVVGGYRAGINYKDKLEDLKCNIDDYDEIIIGSPIWNDRLSTPISSLLDKVDFKDKKLTFIIYSGSGKNKKATKKIEAMYPDARIINIKEPGHKKEELEKITLK